MVVPPCIRLIGLHRLACMVILLLLWAEAFAIGQVPDRPRVIVTTDGEFDDRCSMVRFLLYANEFDIRGIIHSSSKFHWKGRGAIPGHQWHDVSWIDEHLRAYAEVYPTLRQHDPAFPSPAYLDSQVYVGNIDLAGDMEEETPGANRIVEVLLENDPSPVWLQAWGGSNTIARALKTIEEKHPEKKKMVSDKARLFLIMLQDTTYESYIAAHWPDLPVLVSTAFGSIGYPWKDKVPNEYYTYYQGEWMNQHLLSDHGPLLDIYRRHLYGGDRNTGDFISEGDSPAFMHAIPTGLRSLEHPEWGGWGGRFERRKNYWRSAPDDHDKFKAIYRWLPQYQRDMAARADWCVKPYAEANHPPRVVTNVEGTLSRLPGERVRLNAQRSQDPDQDRLSFRWWQYADADSYAGSISIEESSKHYTEFTVPEDARTGDTIHIICEVTDDGTPALTRYQRIVILVSSE